MHSPTRLRASTRPPRARVLGCGADVAPHGCCRAPDNDRRRVRAAAEQFIDQLMQLWSEPYYVCLPSAAERHGAAHQRPQATQVMVRKNRQGIECGLDRIEFVARGDLEQMPVTKLNTPRGVVRYSSAEVTALELVGYPGHAGGLSNVATVLSELSEDLSEELSADKLLEAARLCPVSWSQRFGYLLELVGQQDLADVLAPFVKENAHSHTPLRRAGVGRPPTEERRPWSPVGVLAHTSATGRRLGCRHAFGDGTHRQASRIKLQRPCSCPTRSRLSP